MGYKFYIMSLLENKTKDFKIFHDFQSPIQQQQQQTTAKSIKRTLQL